MREIRRKLEAPPCQLFRIAERSHPHANIREQAHGVDVQRVVHGDGQHRPVHEAPPVVGNALLPPALALGLREEFRVTHAVDPAVAEKDGGGFVVQTEKDGQAATREYAMVLVAIGRKPNSANLGLENTAIGTDRGFIPVDEFMRTASAEDRARFVEACRRRQIHLDALYAQAMTGMYTEEELFELMGEHDPSVNGARKLVDLHEAGLSQAAQTKRALDRLDAGRRETILAAAEAFLQRCTAEVTT